MNSRQRFEFKANEALENAENCVEFYEEKLTEKKDVEQLAKESVFVNWIIEQTEEYIDGFGKKYGILPGCKVMAPYKARLAKLSEVAERLTRGKVCEIAMERMEEEDNSGEEWKNA